MSKDDYLRSYKSEDAPDRYEKCLKCKKFDEGFVPLAEFGICSKCWEGFKKKIPENLRVPLGRMLLYSSKTR